jgi:hypothetical protein
MSPLSMSTRLTRADRSYVALAGVALALLAALSPAPLAAQAPAGKAVGKAAVGAGKKADDNAAKAAAVTQAAADASAKAKALDAAKSPVDRINMKTLEHQASLTYKREVFDFPILGNTPFASLVLKDDDLSPKLSDLIIDAVILDQRAPQRSVVFLVPRATDGSPKNTDVPIRLHVGERRGNFKVLTIQSNGITADVTQAGRTQRVLLSYPVGTEPEK